MRKLVSGLLAAAVALAATFTAHTETSGAKIDIPYTRFTPK